MKDNDKVKQFFALLQEQIEKENTVDSIFEILDYFRCNAENIDIVVTNSLLHVNDLIQEEDRSNLLHSLYFLSEFRLLIQNVLNTVKVQEI